VSCDEVPFLQVVGFAEVAAAKVGYCPSADVSVSNSLSWLPEQGVCVGASGIHAEGGRQKA
jgi:hypothetical protein